jgi:hypothetical protein
MRGDPKISLGVMYSELFISGSNKNKTHEFF